MENKKQKPKGLANGMSKESEQGRTPHRDVQCATAVCNDCSCSLVVTLHEFFTVNPFDKPFGYLIQRYLNFHEVVHLNLLCKGIKIIDVVWQFWYEKIWKPSESLFVLKSSYENQRDRMKSRWDAKRTDLLLNVSNPKTKYIFEGYSMDIVSCNITPATAHVTVRDDYHFDGHINIRAGTNHNKETTGSWTHGFIGANIIRNGGKRYFQLEWREMLPTNRGYFEYIGYLSRDCKFVYGTFSWSMFPRKIQGIFGFLIVAHSMDDVNARNEASSIVEYRQQVQSVYDRCVSQETGGISWLNLEICDFLKENYKRRTAVLPRCVIEETGVKVLVDMIGKNLLSNNCKLIEHAKDFGAMFIPLVPRHLHIYARGRGK